MEHEQERRAKAAESNHKVKDCPRRVIPCEEYMAHREARKKTLTIAKLTSQEGPEEDWDDEPLCPPQDPPPGARSVLPSQEDEWR